MNQGTISEARELAVTRWASLHSFDLHADTWTALFTEFSPGDILQAISKSKTCRDPRPERLYDSLLYWLTRMAKERDEKERPIWPPSDVTPTN